MSGYVKKIAVIKQLKGGFSADGGNISGLVKAETYAGFLKVEVSLINLAPLTEGRYLLGISDGLNTVTFEGASFEGESELCLNSGFAFLLCFYKDSVFPVASAACGQMACALPDLKEEMAKWEPAKKKKGGAAYDDEAITENNYYEQGSADKGGDAVRQNKKEKKEQAERTEDEEALRAVQGLGEEGAGGLAGGLAGGDFYSRMKEDIDKIFSTYPRERGIEGIIEGSRFVRVNYKDNKYYVFGVMSVDGKPRYILYGVPAMDKTVPPPSLKNLATYVATPDGGYFVVVQDAATGVTVKLLRL